MGDTRPRPWEADESSRWGDSKTPRLELDLLAATAAAEVDDPLGREECSGLTGDDDDRCCDHVPTDSAQKEILSSSLQSDDAGRCKDCCLREQGSGGPPKDHRILVCLECGRHSCGDSRSYIPYGHARDHAKQEQHWVAVLFDDPQVGFCFKCECETALYPEPDDEMETTGEMRAGGRGGHAFGFDMACDLATVEMTGKVLPESRRSVFGVDLADIWPSYEVISSDAQGYAIRGIPNLGNTCYMSAVLQCLFALGKLRERMLALDRPKSLLAKVLKELFVEASAAGDVLNPIEVLKCVQKHRVPFFKDGEMEDSHEFLGALCNIWNEGEQIDNTQSDAPTVIDSVFRFEMARTLSCKKCGHSSAPKSEVFLNLSVTFPPKWHPTKTAASPQTSKSPRSQKKEIAVQLFPADVQRNLEKMQTVSESGDSHVIGSEVTVEETHKSLEVDSTQAQHISQSKDVVQSPLQIQEGKSADSLTEDSISIEDFLLLFSEGQVEWHCPNCGKDHEEPSASQSTNGEQIVGSGNEDDVGDTVKIYHFTMLPPVLTLHLKRNYYQTLMVDNMVDRTVEIKISDHVRFMEYLDAGRFMDPSSIDIGSTLYRLAGVVEHIGTESVKSGHYIAYVRARRLGNQQEDSSCSSSWFCANDRQIRQVPIERVLESQAYILFYERMEDQDISGMRRQN